MEPANPISPPSTATATATAMTPKLRLMCSYGGRILPRPCSNSLFYAGGETRIVSIDRQTVTSLSSFLSHLTSSLSLHFPFILKYQLPHLDLESLVSLASDDDFQNLIDEHDRLSSSSSPKPSRIRVFLFPSHIDHPKTEDWFSDALKGAKIPQKGRNLFMGFDGEARGACLKSGVAGQGRNDGDSSHGHESMVLETSSSFGSTSSSASLTNFPPIKAQLEDTEANLQDNNVKLPSSESVTSDNTVSSAALSYQDPDFSSGILGNGAAFDMRHAPISQFMQIPRPQAQFVQSTTHYASHNSSGLVPMSPYYQMYQPVQPLPQVVYQPAQPYPVYFVPVTQMPTCNLPAQCGLADTATASVLPSLHQTGSFITPQVVHNNPEEITEAPSVPDLSSQNYRTNNSTAFVHLTYNGVPQQVMAPSHVHEQPQATVMSRESPECGSELDEDAARAQIYKSQPPPPSLPSRYQTMTTSISLSEAYAQLSVDNPKQ